ncbi:biotin--[acetyl-CoA-carboxylase] ligase [Aurantimonas sp. MSK8Z-1]|uniref:biotin--[acetyl-CoA-carboxylase] ligase n=1 Tax=Mangrovibrevibacter kandeliae TaxID=2968473 RepID=UPI0021195CEE|nr:biotin--[acetyl-CoA-carboxylase] ligase [Aurantimonas sp. MSK8Z-1]MCW4114531.1 biotin--[acetyl-CoA-carboxylase] ligase [Aurantimonas sp. MSK8Z-1]
MATRPRRRLALEAVGSTNTVAFEAARSGDPGPLWVTADRQTAGRGRRGRAWVSEAGNLYASLLLIEPAPLEHLQNLPLVAALGVRDGLASLPARPRPDIRIKWPNDILIGGRKAVGILTETERLPDGRRAVVIGCGVNVAYVPGETPYPVTGLAAEGLPADLDLVFEALAGGVETALDLWDRGQNFAAVRRDWLAHASGLGEACTINLPDRSLKGRFVALDEAGRLLLDEEGGARRAISAGELFLPDRLR